MKKNKLLMLVGTSCLSLPLAVVAFMGSLALAATPAAAATEPRAPESIKIGSVTPITGRFASGGLSVRIAQEIAVDFINKAGGVFVKEFGKMIPLELILMDNESDPVKSVSRMEGLYQTHKVVGFVGGFGSALQSAAVPIAEKYKVPFLGGSFSQYSIHEKAYKYLFSTHSKTPYSTVTVFELVKSLPPTERPTKVAIFRLKEDWGIEVANYCRKLAPSGMQIVVDMEYAFGTKDFTPLILKAKAAGAEVLWSNPVVPDGITIVRQSKELGWTPKMSYLVRAAAERASWVGPLGKDADYTICDSPYYWAFPFPGNKEFVDEYKKRAGQLPDTNSGPAYVNVQILV